MVPAYSAEEELDSANLEDDDPRARVTRPSDSGVRWSDSLGEQLASRSELEWRLHHRGRFAPEHHSVPVATLQRLDAMFDSLPSATTVEDAICVVRTAFTNEAEQRAALVPLLSLLFPIFDDRMPTPDIIRLIANHEMRKPARPL
jgi:hypothetical protein